MWTEWFGEGDKVKMILFQGNKKEKGLITTELDSTNLNKALWVPMKIVQVYLTLVFLLFIFGPWPWPLNNSLLVYFYLFLAQALLYLGYFLSVRRKKITVYISQLRLVKIPTGYSIRFIRFLLILSFIIFIPNYLVRTGLTTFSINELFNNFIGGLVNPSEQYIDRMNMTDTNSMSTLLVVITGITAPFRWLLIPLSIINWDKLKLFDRIGVIAFIALDVMSWIAIGTNKGIFDNIFIIVFSLLIKTYMDSSKVKFRSKSNKGKIILIFLSVTMLIAAIAYMTKAIKSRFTTYNYYSPSANIWVDFNSPIISITPDFLKDTLVVVSSYITQGYYGLSLALREGFSMSFGFGNSWFLLNVFERITGNMNLAENTYPFKIIKYGWDPYINWQSFYTWIASDFSFIGTLILMILIGYVFGEVWKSVLMQKNLYAVGLFSLFMIMFMYIPANNQVFAFTNTFFSFWGLFILWLFTSRIRV